MGPAGALGWDAQVPWVPARPGNWLCDLGWVTLLLCLCVLSWRWGIFQLLLLMLLWQLILTQYPMLTVVWKWKWKSRSVMSDSFWPHGLYSPWNSPGQNIGVGSLSLLQGIFPTQELNPDLPHWRWILYQLSHQGNPRISEWVAYPFSSRSSRPRNRTGVSCIAGGFFTNWIIVCCC